MKRFVKLLACALALALLASFGCAAFAADPADDYLGVWEYDEYYLWFDFLGDGTWYAYNERDMVLDGYYEITADGDLQMYFPDGTEYYLLTPTEDGLIDNEDDTLTASELPGTEDSNLTDFGAVGIWHCVSGEKDYWIGIYPGGKWAAYDSDGFLNRGYVHLTGRTLYLLEGDDDDESTAMLTLTISGILAVDGDGCLYMLGSLPFSHGSILDL